MQAVHSSAVGMRHEAQTRSGIQRIGGAAGAINGVVDLAVVAILIPTLSRYGVKMPIEGNPATFYDYLHAMLPVFLPLFLLQTAVAIFAFAFVRALDERLRPVAPTASSIAAIFGYAGFVLLMLDFASFVVLEQSINAGDSRQTVEGMIPAWSMITGTAGVVGGFLMVGWLLLVNWIAVRYRGLPKALGYLGLVAGVIALAGPLLAVHGFPHLLANVWQIAAGVALFLGTQPAAGRKVADLP
jgi:hypothetical protein